MCIYVYSYIYIFQLRAFMGFLCVQMCVLLLYVFLLFFLWLCVFSFVLSYSDWFVFTLTYSTHPRVIKSHRRSQWPRSHQDMANTAENKRMLSPPRSRLFKSQMFMGKSL